MKHITASHLAGQLLDLGVRPGGVLLVHTAYSKIKPVEGGPDGLIAALRRALGPDSTLVMPSMCWEDETLFDPRATPCPEMGAVAETFWRQADVLRSDSPHAFAAVGPHAERVVAAPPIDLPHGSDSPVGRVHALDGQILLLGVGHSSNTTLHLAENLAGVRYGFEDSVTVLRDGAPVRVAYTEVGACCQRFALAEDWLMERGLQRTGPVGHGTGRLMRSRDLVEVALEYLRRDETVFLHARDAGCEDCDEARSTLEGAA